MVKNWGSVFEDWAITSAVENWIISFAGTLAVKSTCTGVLMFSLRLNPHDHST
jgi:hypothetical protein